MAAWIRVSKRSDQPLDATRAGRAWWRPNFHSATHKSATLSRRTLILGGGAMLITGARPAAAQHRSWLESLSGFGERPPQSGQSPTKQVASGLRSGSMPWRSDEMLQAMDAAIERAERLVAGGACPIVPGGSLLRASDDDERVVALKARLGRAGLLHASTGYMASASFDERLEEAVRQTQARFGLRATGRLDRVTLAVLNVPADIRLAQLKLNRHRIEQLLADRVEDRHVFVNAAAFELEAVERYEVRLRHRVIVGKLDRQTPAIKSSIRAVNFFPAWHVPESVARLDLIPRLRKQPDYLGIEQMRVTTSSGAPLDPSSIDWRTADARKLRFRQEPDPHNALGLVRIDMPNDEYVYLHDTPMKPLFAQQQRAFSAGCVRVQDVFKLVEWLVQYERGWEQPGSVERTIAAGQPVTVKLARPVPVHFSYLTAWAEADGMPVFRPDIYGRDGLRYGPSEQDPGALWPAQSLSP